MNSTPKQTGALRPIDCVSRAPESDKPALPVSSTATSSARVPRAETGKASRQAGNACVAGRRQHGPAVENEPVAPCHCVGKAIAECALAPISHPCTPGFQRASLALKSGRSSSSISQCNDLGGVFHLSRIAEGGPRRSTVLSALQTPARTPLGPLTAGPCRSRALPRLAGQAAPTSVGFADQGTTECLGKVTDVKYHLSGLVSHPTPSALRALHRSKARQAVHNSGLTQSAERFRQRVVGASGQHRHIVHHDRPRGVDRHDAARGVDLVRARLSVKSVAPMPSRTASSSRLGLPIRACLAVDIKPTRAHQLELEFHALVPEPVEGLPASFHVRPRAQVLRSPRREPA